MSVEHLNRSAIDVALPQLNLHGELAFPYAPARGLLVVVGSCAESRPAEGAEADEERERAMHREGFATLRIDLLRAEECRFADAREHLPLLTERLLAVIGHLRQQILLEAIPALPIGLVAAGAMTPLAVRVAAQRDREVHAVVCHGGLIDLAGLQYLQALQAPLLLLAETGDTAALANAQRAQAHITAIFRIETLGDGDRGLRRQRETELTLAWFRCHLES